MADSDIEWTEKVWNITRGCRRVSTGCGGPNNEGGCYAERQAYRFSGKGQPYEGLVTLSARGPRWTGKGYFATEKLTDPLRWRMGRKVFVNSMSDLFFDAFSNEQIAAVFGVMAACPQHTFQILTKRPERAVEWFSWYEGTSGAGASSFAARAAADEAFPPEYRARLKKRGAELVSGFDPDTDRWPLPNVHLGVSCENQETANERIPLLLQCPAAVRWVSAEPLLGPLNLLEIHLPEDSPKLDWVVLGSESGPGARPMDISWGVMLVRRCRAAGVACFTKQIANARDRKGGDPKYWPVGDWPREYPR